MEDIILYPGGYLLYPPGPFAYIKLMRVFLCISWSKNDKENQHQNKYELMEKQKKAYVHKTTTMTKHHKNLREQIIVSDK